MEQKPLTTKCKLCLVVHSQVKKKNERNKNAEIQIPANITYTKHNKYIYKVHEINLKLNSKITMVTFLFANCFFCCIYMDMIFRWYYIYSHSTHHQLQTTHNRNFTNFSIQLL